MLKTSIFKLQVSCPGCGALHALAGFHEQETCLECGKIIPLREFYRSRLFGGADMTKYMNGFLSGTVEQIGGGAVNQAGAYKMTYSSRAAYCEECFKEAPEADIMSAINNNTPFACACGHKMPVKPADDFIRSIHPKILGILNDSEGKDFMEKDVDEKKQMIVFSCMTCGAGLQLSSDSGRMIKCQYCDNENYLPDAIWGKLHPDKDVEPFFVILDLDGADISGCMQYFLGVTMLRVYEKHFLNFIREYFENPFQSDSLKVWLSAFLAAKNNPSGFNLDITKPQRYFYEQFGFGMERQSGWLRETVAAYAAGLPVDLQMKLAHDPEPTVRLALARNVDIHKDAVKVLQNDSNPEVTTEAKKHKTGLFKGLFG
jgi:hypothetical protein